jgi:antitoxin (DNA-binding transcriptional repressor) of toxin-antitoxin stability system
MTVSLTELRQRLFQLADQVVETGEPVLIDRRGVRLRLSRDDAPAPRGRLARLATRTLVVGEPLRPDESPAAWTEALRMSAGVAETTGTVAPRPRVRKRRP